MKSPGPTPDEMAALHNAGFFRLKLSLDDKVKELFKVLKLELEQSITQTKDSVPSELTSVAGRTFRGENHQGFPWRALDCPRQMAKPDLFIFRTLLLWGHHFSFHLLLSGKWKLRLLESLAHNSVLLNGDWLIDLRSDTWQWQHPGQNAHICGQSLSQENLQQLSNLETVKISRFLPLDKFGEIPAEGLAAWNSLANALFPTTES